MLYTHIWVVYKVKTTLIKVRLKTIVHPLRWGEAGFRKNTSLDNIKRLNEEIYNIYKKPCWQKQKDYITLCYYAKRGCTVLVYVYGENGGGKDS